MKAIYQLKSIISFLCLLSMQGAAAQNLSTDSLNVKPTIVLDIQQSDNHLNTPERAKIDLEHKDLTTIPAWKVKIPPQFKATTDLSTFVSDQIMEIENIFGTNSKAGQTIYEAFIDTQGRVDSLMPTVSGGEYLDNCFMAAILETSGKWTPASYNNRTVRTSIKIKVQYRVEWYPTWTKLNITAHSMK